MISTVQRSRSWERIVLAPECIHEYLVHKTTENLNPTTNVGLHIVFSPHPLSLSVRYNLVRIISLWSTHYINLRAKQDWALLLLTRNTCFCRVHWSKLLAIVRLQWIHRSDEYEFSTSYNYWLLKNVSPPLIGHWGGVGVSWLTNTSFVLVTKVVSVVNWLMRIDRLCHTQAPVRIRTVALPTRSIYHTYIYICVLVCVCWPVQPCRFFFPVQPAKLIQFHRISDCQFVTL